MIDQLRQMAIFAKAIDHGSFRGAATELRLSPSVVSHHISQLEEHLGVALVYRTTRKLRLTPQGERLLAATRKMLDAVEGELLDLTSIASEPSGELRVTAPSVLSKSPLMPTIALFLRTYPRVRLTLDFSDERRELLDDGFDLAIRMMIAPARAANTRKLFDVHRRVVASPDYMANRSIPTEPTEIADWPWLELAPVRHAQATFQRGEATQSIPRSTSQLSCNDAQGLYRLALAGIGLAIVPEFLAAEDHAAGRICYPIPDWNVAPATVFAQWPASAPKHGLIKLLIDMLSTKRSDF